MIELSKQEQQLVEILREWTGNDEYRLDIERTGGAWEIKLSIFTKRRRNGREVLEPRSMKLGIAWPHHGPKEVSTRFFQQVT
jgi:hypothetical protein